MTSNKRICMTKQAHARLQNELAALRSRPSIEVPDDFMDTDQNLIARYKARRKRIGQIRDLLTKAIIGEDAAEDGIAEPGTIVTVHYDDTGETSTFLLGGRGAEDAETKTYSMRSPIGRAITGARPGEQRTYTLPGGVKIAITLLNAVPYGPNARTCPPPQPDPPQHSRGRCRPEATTTSRGREAKHAPKTSLGTANST